MTGEISVLDWMRGDETDGQASSPPRWRPVLPSASTEPRTSSSVEPAKPRLPATLHPAAEQIIYTILEAAEANAPRLPVDVLQTADGGVTVEFENEALGRELVFAIPADGCRRFFTAGSAGYRLSGAVELDIAFDQLLHWASGSASEVSTIGLVLPRANSRR